MPPYCHAGAERRLFSAQCKQAMKSVVSLLCKWRPDSTQAPCSLLSRYHYCLTKPEGRYTTASPKSGLKHCYLHSTTSTLLWPQRNPRTTTRQITRIKLLKKSMRSSGKITQGPSLDESERLTLPPTVSAFWVASESNSGWPIREKTAATPLQAP